MVYVKQYNNGRHSCGPIAILNALKFQKRKFYRKHLPKIADGLKVTKIGTSTIDFERYLKRMKIGWRMRRPTFRKIDKALVNGCGILICVNFIRDGKRSGHMMFVPGIRFHGEETKWYLTNAPYGEHRWVEREWLEEYYHKSTDYYWFYPIWIVPPRKRK